MGISTSVWHICNKPIIIDQHETLHMASFSDNLGELSKQASVAQFQNVGGFKHQICAPHIYAMISKELDWNSARRFIKIALKKIAQISFVVSRWRWPIVLKHYAFTCGNAKQMYSDNYLYLKNAQKTLVINMYSDKQMYFTSHRLSAFQVTQFSLHTFSKRSTNYVWFFNGIVNLIKMELKVARVDENSGYNHMRATSVG